MIVTAEVKVQEGNDIHFEKILQGFLKVMLDKFSVEIKKKTS